MDKTITYFRRRQIFVSWCSTSSPPSYWVHKPIAAQAWKCCQSQTQRWLDGATRQCKGGPSTASCLEFQNCKGRGGGIHTNSTVEFTLQYTCTGNNILKKDNCMKLFSKLSEIKKLLKLDHQNIRYGCSKLEPIFDIMQWVDIIIQCIYVITTIRPGLEQHQYVCHTLYRHY